jgi:protein-disulfide isomerase
MTDQIEVLAVSEPKPTRHVLTALGLLLVVGVFGAAAALAGKTYIDRAVDSRVAEAIRSQPALIAETLKTYIAQQQEEGQRKDEASVLSLADEMRRDAGLPTRGPADAKVTIVYFFDSNCPYCKQMEPILKPLAESGKVRVVYREIPILGPASETAARFGAALWKTSPDTWIAFHTAVMGNRGHVDEAAVMRIAMGSTGAETVGRTMAALQDPQASAPVQQSLDLAKRAGIHGTPFILVGDTMFRGAVSAEQLAAAVAKTATAAR